MTKLTLFAAMFVLLTSSCVLSHTAILTNNPVGSKRGVAATKLIDPAPDFTFKRAKEKGDISKVGIAEVKLQQILIFPKITTTVTGE